MIIEHELNDFLFDLFPKAKANQNDLEVLREELVKYYTFEVYKPEITIENNIVTIKIDTSTIINQEGDYKRVVAFCEKGKFAKAKPILDGLIKKNPTNSEYHRIFGQILSEEGNQEDAINSLIDAIKWDNKNGWALIMMGNIFAKYKNDFITAKKYYDEAVRINPENYIAINNIGENLMQQGKFDEAKDYFKEMPKDKIKKIALEIALQGSQGYRPDKKDYRVSSIPGKVFSGYHILAYYYVSWKLTSPEMLPQLRLPFDKEYELAISFNKK